MRRTALLTLAAVLALLAVREVRPPAPSPTGDATGSADSDVVRHRDDRRDDAPRGASGETAAVPVVPAVRTRTKRRPNPDRTLLFPDAAPRSGELETIARDVLAGSWDEAGLDAMDGELREVQSFGSLSGWHLRFEQMRHGVPVHGSEVSVHVAPNGRPLLMHAQVFPLTGAAVVPQVSLSDARAVAHDVVLGAEDDEDGVDPLRVERLPELVLLPERKGARLVWKVDVGGPDQSLRVFVDATSGDPVRADPLQVSAEGQARVFKPNPVYSRRDTELRDRADEDQQVLTNAREYVVLPRLDGTGFLRGDWVDVTATSSPVQSDSLVFTHITRGDRRFEQLMCYYHIDRLQQRLQDLGVTNVNAEPQRCDAHARTDDQSIYDFLTDTLEFGSGGVDDAEDADIILHEYGHAVQFAQVRNFGTSGQAGAMGEGFSDFLAVSEHRENDSRYDPAVASWDAVSYDQGNPPALRRVDGNKVYPDDVRNQVHDDGEIWSAFLWDLRQLLGNDTSLVLAVEAHFFLAPQPSFKDGANGILSANIAIRDGQDDAEIRNLLRARGLPFSTPVPVPLEEDEYEPNDSVTAARAIGTGVHQLLLADEDWFQFTVPAYQRLVIQAEFDPEMIDLDLEVRDVARELIARADGVGELESLDVTAGESPRLIYLRVFDANTGIGAGGYTLTVTQSDLPDLEPNRTMLLQLLPASEPVLRVAVPAKKVEKGRRLKIVTKRVGKGGALTDLQVSRPGGVVELDYGAKRKRKGSKAVVRPDLPGFWVVRVRTRDGTSGTAKVKAKIVR